MRTLFDIPHIPFRLTGLKPLEPYQQPVLAKDVVRYVGEPIAAIFADDPISPKTPQIWWRCRSNHAPQRCLQPMRRVNMSST